MIDHSAFFDIEDVEVENADPVSMLRLKTQPRRVWYEIKGGEEDKYRVRRSPGERQDIDAINIGGVDYLLASIDEWLKFANREIIAAELADGTGEREPPWFATELPPEYHDVIHKMAALEALSRRHIHFGRLLWATGKSLNGIVAEVFQEFGLQAEETAPGATYDVTVTLPTGRLLIEITGIEGLINKGSKKITQVLTVQQTVLQPQDRVCVAVNAYRTKPPNERRGLDIATPEALGLLTRLNAAVFTTSDLYRLWREHLEGHDVTTKIETVLVAPPGVVPL